MKKLIFTTLLFSSIIARSSAQAVIADPALTTNTALPTQLVISTIDGAQINPFLVPKDSIVRLKVPVYNLNTVNGIPQATTKIKVALGPRLELDPGFNLTTMNTSAYFTWTRVFDGYEDFITGILVTPLPANFTDSAIFNIRGKSLTLNNPPSIIVANFLVTNNNPNIILSDENGSNNGQSLSYKVIEGSGPLPVTFTKVMAVREACTIKVNFDTENEINVDRFEIETSEDGIRFDKVGVLAASNAGQYSFLFSINNVKTAQLFIRIKSVDKDDRFQYSTIIKVKADCSENKFKASIYPNPVSNHEKEIIIRANENPFNGNYTITLVDMLGKLLNNTNRTFSNAVQFNYEINNLAAGQYVIKLQSSDGLQFAAIKFQKL